MESRNPYRGAQFAQSVFDQYRHALHRFLVRRLRRREDASDLAQEVYLRLLRIADPTLVRGPLPYLYRIASNLVHEFHLREQQDPVRFDSEVAEQGVAAAADERPDALAEQLELEQEVERLLGRLPPVQRAVVIMQKRDGLSYAEIAQQLGLSVSTVETYLFRALATLRGNK